MLTAPQPTPYDLHFRLIGFDIRVSVSFWIGAIFFGFGLVRGWDRLLDINSPGIGPLLMLWALCMFTSIAVHELGHALAFRSFGVHSHIVLYHFGGLAIPTAGTSYDSIGTELSPGKDWIVAAAGPAAQLGSAILLALVVRFSGHYVEGLFFLPDPLQLAINSGELRELGSPITRTLVVFYLLPSIFWAVLNCIPVYPLDGGRVAKATVEFFSGPDSIWLWIGIGSSLAVVVFSLLNDDFFLALLFGLLAISNYQTLQQRTT